MKLILLAFFIGFTSFSFGQPPKTNLAFSEASVQVKLYPNPAITVVNFEFQNAADKGYSLRIFNFLGKKVWETMSVTDKISVPLTEFYRGVYIYQLTDKSGRLIESGKFQVSK